MAIRQAAKCIFHYKIGKRPTCAAMDAKIVDWNDIGMLEACYDTRFLQKSFLQRFAYTGLEYFNRHLPLKVGVSGKINICHASTSNTLNEAIVTDMLSRE